MYFKINLWRWIYWKIQIKNLKELLLYKRFKYRIGEPVESDSEFDTFVESIKLFCNENKSIENDEIVKILSTNYDCDTVDSILSVSFLTEDEKLKAVQLRYENIDKNIDNDKKDILNFLNKDKTGSIDSVKSKNELRMYLTSLPSNAFTHGFFLSLKVDGVNCKTAFNEGEHKLSISRGRKGTSIDYSRLRKVIPKVNCPNLLRTVSEVFVGKEDLLVLKEKYKSKDVKFSTSKSSAISLLRSEYSESDYMMLNVLSFNLTQTNKPFNTVEDMYKEINNIGLKTPPYLSVKCNTLEEYIDKIDELFITLDKDNYYPSDGVVIRPNNMEYENSMLALKYKRWSSVIYEGKVINIVFSNAENIRYSAILEIEPVEFEDGAVGKRVNAYNPSFVIKNNIRVGSNIIFERKSNTITNFIKIKDEERDDSNV